MTLTITSDAATGMTHVTVDDAREPQQPGIHLSAMRTRYLMDKAKQFDALRKYTNDLEDEYRAMEGKRNRLVDAIQAVGATSCLSSRGTATGDRSIDVDVDKFQAMLATVQDCR